MEKLQYLQRKREKKKKGSNNYKKLLVAEQRAHLKIKNIRDDFQHKIAKQLIVENDILIVEDLNVQQMLEKKKEPQKEGEPFKP